MRIVHYSVINKETNKKVFTHWDRNKCIKFLETLENAEAYGIAYKWVSI
jgi:hypothetical protein